MLLDSETLARLRDELIQRGGRTTTPPAADGTPPTEPSPKLRAIMARVAPLCEVLYLLMTADDERHVREQDVLRGAIRALTEGALRKGSIDVLLASYEEALRAHGRERRLAQVSAQLAADREDAEAAFVLAAVMAIADEEAALPERDMLEELRELLGVSEARADVLLGIARDSLA